MTSDLDLMEGSWGVRKGAWSEEEDKLLKQCIETNGEGKWHQVPLKAGLNRCRKSCRLRWLNHLKPNIKRGKFEVDEVDLMIRLHKLLGNRWSLIAGRLPGRTANDVKNYWNTHQKKRAIPFEEDKKAEIQKVTKANITRPRPWSFSKNLVSSSTERTQVFQNNVQLGGDQNHHKTSTALQAASENTESVWWECLLNDTDQEEAPRVAGPSGESFSRLEATVDGTLCGASQSFLSDFSFDVDVWNFFNAEN